MRASNDSSNYLFCFFFDSIKRLENSQRTIFLRFKTFPPFSSILLCSTAVCVRFSQVCFVLSPDPNNSIFRLEKIAAITKSANKNERMRENESLCVRSFLEVFQIQRIRLFFIVCFLLEFGSVCRFVLFVCERGDCFIFNARMSNVIENNTENVASWFRSRRRSFSLIFRSVGTISKVKWFNLSLWVWIFALQKREEIDKGKSFHLFSVTSLLQLFVLLTIFSFEDERIFLECFFGLRLWRSGDIHQRMKTLADLQQQQQHKTWKNVEST